MATTPNTNRIPINNKLRILVLKHLAARPRAGYGLIKEIHECTGWKPSYGSIYPLLDHLRKEGLVTVEETPKKKIYHLTPEGKLAAKALNSCHAEMITQMQENMKLMAHIIGFKKEQHDDIMELFFNAMRKGEQPMKEIMESSMRLKTAAWNLYRAGLVKTEKERIDAIMDEAAEKLNRIMVEAQERKGRL